jgi:hypothetical protein
MALTAAAAGMQAVGQYQQGQVAKQVGRNNQIMAEYAAQDALQRGDQEANAALRRARQTAGTQRATMAARGLDLTEGSPADLLDQTSFFGEQDAATARLNARREAWSARVQGANAAREGSLAARNANLSAFGTVLTGSTRVADTWYRHNPPAPRAPRAG